MLLSVPPRTGISPYGGYAGKSYKKVKKQPLDHFYLLCPEVKLPSMRRCSSSGSPLKICSAVLSCSVLEIGSRKNSPTGCCNARIWLSPCVLLHCNKESGACYIVPCGLPDQFGFVCSDTVATLFLFRAYAENSL
ncbi:hypothetical protein GOODEAATRI_020307 [Goodea atripinnis]|uniref:Uncharacterized protein n=1 Tax=Goodea atripinnis TaxID=208336 RepID=A0ABV0P6F1_9TELE